MGKSSPAFQFYPGDFIGGTTRMTTSEVGGYILLLCEQWQTGSVPGDDEQALAALMRCSKASARSIWKRISNKFDQDEDGVWRNARLERVRSEQIAYRAERAERGRAGARKRWQEHGTGDSTAMAEPCAVPLAEPPVRQWHSDSSSISDLRSLDQEVPDPTTSTPSEGPRRSSSPLMMSPARYAKLQQTHAFVGSRLHVPHVLHDELRRKLGGLDPDGRLRAWYGALNDEAEQQQAPIPDVFQWLRPKFVEWAREQSTAADLERFRPKVMP